MAVGITLPEHHYLEILCQRITLHGHSYRGIQPVPYWSLEVKAGQWASAAGALPAPSYSHVPGELVNALSQMKAAETSLLMAVPKHGYTFRSHPDLFPLTTGLWLCLLV